MFILSAIYLLVLLESKPYLTHLNCTGTAQAIKRPLTERQKDDKLSTSLSFLRFSETSVRDVNKLYVYYGQIGKKNYSP